MDLSQRRKAVIADPEWLAHRYDAAVDAFQFRQVPRTRHAEVPFLTDNDLGEPDALVPVPRTEALSLLGERAPVHFVFHSAFCASTMLVRAFDTPGVAMGLSEPMLCNDMIGWLRRGGDRRGVAAALDASLALLSRPFAPGEAVVVKPSNIFNPLIRAALSLRPEARGVLLYAPLPVFLASVARKGLWCRLWCRELLEGQLQDGIVGMGLEPRDLFRMSDLQVAAVGWLAQHRLFAELLAAYGPDRLGSLDSETLTADAPRALVALADHYGLAHEADDRARLLASPALTRHSKFGQSFTSDDRAAERAAAKAAYGEEIDLVLRWAEVLATNNGIAFTLDHPLIG